MNQMTLTFDVPDTRRMAHKKVQPGKKHLHVRLLKDFYMDEFGADEWASDHNVSILSARPRVTELFKAGLLRCVGYGLTLEGNPQREYALTQPTRDRLTRLAAEFGMDAAVEQLLAEHGLK